MEPPTSSPTRLPLVDALRALAAFVIAGHHFARCKPLADWASKATVYGEPLVGSLLQLLNNWGRWTPVFFVAGGYVMALSMERRTWGFRQVGSYTIGRYLRLGIPYLATIVVAIAAAAFARVPAPDSPSAKRTRLPDKLVGDPPTIRQVAAHVVLMQDILDRHAGLRYAGEEDDDDPFEDDYQPPRHYGYESLSAGLWFICIYFQLGLIYVALLFLRDQLRSWLPRVPERLLRGVPLMLGMLLAGASLFYFNLVDYWDVWALYFFAQFFLGVMVYHALQNRRGELLFFAFLLLVCAALDYRVANWLSPQSSEPPAFRWKLFGSALCALTLYVGSKLGIIGSWPRSRVIGYLGRSSYSFFLIHFPVLLAVATIWVKYDWNTPWVAVTGLIMALIASLAAAALFYRFVERPATRLSRRFS